MSDDNAPVTAEMEQAATASVNNLKTLKNEITDIESIFREVYPDMWARYAECKGEIKATTDEVKTNLRKLGPGKHVFGRMVCEVRRASEKIEVDSEALIDRASARGEVEELIQAGVLTYQVTAHQVARLPGKQKAAYLRYLSKKMGTPAVVLPRELK